MTCEPPPIRVCDTPVRTNLKTRAEVDTAIDELRQIMTALDAPLIRANSEQSAVPIESSMPAQTQIY